ncbi:hypothetical protein IQ06DRAFT_296506 [Phaeosphaeriaceae sp. SRC1lsM3a]|nr:hypothetical protein IQ06DRAFT_296506 [Stagonospora sp. SRC1lsM3a]
MTPSNAHLLQIPREIRDQILSYLEYDHDVPFPWTWTKSRKRRTVFEITLPNAPRLSVLLTCSRLYEEYMQQSVNKSMVVRWDGGVKRRVRGKALEKHPEYKKAFSRVENITFVIDLGGEEGRIPWLENRKLDHHLLAMCIEFFKSHTSRLSSVIVISRKCAVQDAWHPWQPNVVGTMRPGQTSTGRITDTLGGLQLVRLGRAMCLYSNIDDRYWRRSSASVRNSIYQLQMRYYASDSHTILHPAPEQAQAQFKSYTIETKSKSVGGKRKPLERHEILAIDEVACRMWGWEELRGEDVYKSKEVLRVVPAVDNEPPDVVSRADQEDGEGSDHYFDWDEIMLDARDGNDI